jgi:tetratricopeptide (TPR) repeat protein
LGHKDDLFDIKVSAMGSNSKEQTVSSLDAQLEILGMIGIPSFEQVDALNDLACALQETDRQRCLTLSKEAVQLGALLKYSAGKARAHNRLGWLSLLAGEVEIALQHAMQAEALALLAKNPRLQCGALYVSASAHQQVNNVAFALRDWFKLLHIALQEDDQDYQADAYNELGILYREQKDYEDAIDCCKQALKRYVASGDPREVVALNNIAHAYARTGDGVHALVYARMALDKCSPELPRWRATILDTMGRACLANGNIRIALAQFESGIKLYQTARVTGQVHADSVIATLYQGAALALRKLGHLDQAAIKLDQALAEAERANDQPLQVEIHQDIASLMALLGAMDMARHHQSKASALGHRLEHEQTVLRERLLSVFRAERNSPALTLALRN